MSFLEKDLEEIIYKAEREELLKRGLSISGIKKRQLRIGNYGIADMVTFERLSTDEISPESKIIDGKEVYHLEVYHDQALLVTVYEFKKDKIGISAFLQAVGYCQGIRRYLDGRDFCKSVIFNIVLVGKVLDKSSTFSYLADIVNVDKSCESFLKCYTYSYDVDGISFDEKWGYSLIDEGFKL